MMKKINLIIVFVISFFILTLNTKADYKASVINPSGAKCSLYGSSTGYCLYANENLNSYVPGPIWLDTGDEVTVITNHATVPTKDTNLCSDYYVYVSHVLWLDHKTYYGYYCNANLAGSNLLTDALRTEFTNAGFPSSYFEKLAILKTAHPNWTFKAVNTNLNFSDAVSSESIASRSLVQLSSSNNYAYMAIDSTSFDYKNDRYIPYDNVTSNDAWYNANYNTIAYYMDPRNFLSDMYIFQFEGLSYDGSVSDDKVLESINLIFSNDYLSRFSNDFLNAGKESRVSPVYLASLSKQEVGGSSSANTAVSGTNGSYPGIYNFYNIGASGGANPVLNGLSYASQNDASTKRPWNTEYKAIVGGALWIGEKYVNVGQDTSFFKKWNIVYNYLLSQNKTPTYSNYTHQYMTNIMAPSSEAFTTYKSYVATGMLNLNYVFYIPVYKNMPDKTSLPTTTGWPNNYLSNITLNDKAIADFDSDVIEYNYNLSTSNIKIGASSISSSASIEGLGNFDIINDTIKEIKVKAQNGNIRTYKINIKLSEELKEAVDIVTTLNNAGIKNGSKYITGLSLNSDISSIKTKIINANSNAKVVLKDNSGNEKNSGIIKTGDKVIVSLNGKIKEYELVIYGDTNGDGKIAASDYVKIKNHIMGRASLSGVYSEAADVNRDGKIAASDYVKIKNQIMGKSTIVQ